MDKAIVVGACIKNKNNEILMVKENKASVNGLYNIPAGKLNTSESIFDAAIREVKEETGYDIKLDSVLCIQYLESKNILKIIFNATIISGEKNYDKNEIMDVLWISINKLELMSDKELRSYKSNIDIIQFAKENRKYPIEIIENI